MNDVNIICKKILYLLDIVHGDIFYDVGKVLYKYCTFQIHTCQVLRFRRSHYGFLEKLKTTAVVRNDYGFTLGWDVFFW